ncbi:two-component system cell cycle response regulator [Nitrobacteraceae bacterium AZCC 2146]
MRILIAEDDAASRLILEAALAGLGHEIITATDGEQAWQLFQSEKVEAIISDREMPGLNGVDLCRRIRASDGGKYIYFIFLTSVTDKAGAAEAIRAGADDYLMKPLNRHELEARLLVASRITELYRELANQHVELERLNSQLFRQARIDGLTQVGNRLKMREDLNILVARVAEQGESFCAVMCDVDHFKLYNDEYGHLQGDEVLKKIARTLVQGCRPNDEVYRYGGEEFLLVMPEQSIEAACTAAERHRARIEQLAIPNIGSPATNVTISAGVASINPSSGPSIKAWLESADGALYRAKQLGRNRVIGPAIV